MQYVCTYSVFSEAPAGIVYLFLVEVCVYMKTKVN